LKSFITLPQTAPTYLATGWRGFVMHGRWRRSPFELTAWPPANFGDCKALQDGVSELRIKWGPGYRVYFAMIGRTRVLLLCGGTKRSQSADIKRAKRYWADYQQRISQE
jgi:putative addiction module killer protein